jgi:hypothetical protein
MACAENSKTKCGVLARFPMVPRRESFQSVTLIQLSGETAARSVRPGASEAAESGNQCVCAQLQIRRKFMRLMRYQFPSVNIGLLVGAWFFLQARSGRAEDAISYKYVDYRESGDRMTVESHYGLIEKDFGPDMHLKLQGVIDAIAGATPTGAPPATPGGNVPLFQTTDRRKGWSGDLARQFSRVNVDAGYAYSRESDYVSNGWSLNTLTDFNQKNTTLLLGAAGTDDDVKVIFQTPWAKKRGRDFIAGVTQLLSPVTSVTFNIGWGRATGFLSDPYRLIEQNTLVTFEGSNGPPVFLEQFYNENRPATREHTTFYAAINHSVAGLNGAIEASYRFFRDTFGTDAHTVDLAWFQKIGERFVLRPGFRFYDQSAANFYQVDLDNAPFTPSGRPAPAGPFFSSDYRLSAFRSYNYGLKAIWTIAAAWQVDAAIERYEMHGRDNVTSRSVYPTATIVTAGLRFSW